MVIVLTKNIEATKKIKMNKCIIKYIIYTKCEWSGANNKYNIYIKQTKKEVNKQRIKQL